MIRRTYRGYQGKKSGGVLFLLAAIVLAGSAIMYVTAPLNIQKFAAFPAILGVFLLLFGVAARISGTAGKILSWGLAALSALLIIGFGVLELAIITGDRTEQKGEPDAVVVLGAQVYSWGPSILLADRLDTACDYLNDHPGIPVVVSGGQGPDEHATEASVMRDYLISKGVEPDRIWLEEQSHNTKENLMYTGELLVARGLDPDTIHLAVVSNGFHLTRVRMLAERQGLDISTLAAPATHFPSKVQSYIREAPALVKSWIFDR